MTEAAPRPSRQISIATSPLLNDEAVAASSASVGGAPASHGAAGPGLARIAIADQHGGDADSGDRRDGIDGAEQRDRRRHRRRRATSVSAPVQALSHSAPRGM